MSDPLRIGIAGLGTVGTGVVRILQTHPDLIASRAGRAIEIVAVSARDKSRKRTVDLSAYEWEDSPESMAIDPRLDVIVELIGGAEGTARRLVEQSLKAGKTVITANKALLAEHGASLAELSDRSGAGLMYEAAVAGGIPIIKALREGFVGNRIRAVHGILNGTCNYILTEMRETGQSFEAVLKRAQEKGYAESDPGLDVDGIDAAHKLSILTGLAFGVKPAFSKISIQGIRHITAADIGHATDLGYRIKLLGTAMQMEDGTIIQIMEPCLVPQDSLMGAIEGVYNAISSKGDFVGTSFLVGRGAGEGATASAVMSDLADCARGVRIPVYGIPSRHLKEAHWGGIGDMRRHFYIHLSVIDKPGILADVSAILRDHQISVEAVLQRSRNPDQPVSIVLTTHDARQSDVSLACGVIAGLKLVVEKPTIMRIERF
jgi:homoserine dehydrogenase